MRECVSFKGKWREIFKVDVAEHKLNRNMSRKRGLSVEEKRKRMMDMFYEKKDFFQLKEIEKIASKEKGINSMSVKEILQSLVDDDMVDSERIGTSNYFWAFPSKALNAKKNKLKELKEKVETYEQKKTKLEKDIGDANVSREDTGVRTELLSDLAEKEQLCEQLSEELERLKECDPEVLEKMTQETKVAHEAANRWTDNVFTIKSWCTKKFGVEEKTINKNFGIPEDFDYID